MSKDPRVYLAQIHERIERIQRYVSGGETAFFGDEMVQDAVIRNLEVIGEAAKRLDDSFRSAHPEIPWRALAGLNDVLIHQYEGVDLQRVWAIVEREQPGLRTAISEMLPPLDQLESELAEGAAPPYGRETGSPSR